MSRELCLNWRKLNRREWFGEYHGRIVATVKRNDSDEWACWRRPIGGYGRQRCIAWRNTEFKALAFLDKVIWDEVGKSLA